MRNIAIVGRPQVGKTTLAKRIALEIGFPLVVNDVNVNKTTRQPEWGQRPLTVTEFLDIMDRRKGTPTTFVWEEATGYLATNAIRKADQMRVIAALTRRFHTAHVNLLMFHSLRAMPVWVTDYLDRLLLFKTNDRPGLIASKFRGWDIVLEAHERANRHPDVHHVEDISTFGT